MKELIELPSALLQNNPWNAKGNSIWPATIFQCKRNIARSNFPGKLSGDELIRVFQLLKEQILKFFGQERCQVFAADQLAPLDKEFLFEHFLCREGFQDASSGQGFVVDKEGKFLGLLNIQDHLSLQWIDTVDSWEQTWSELAKLEEIIASQLAFAFSPMFGFLTANPHDCGTALQVSSLVHVPILFHLKALDPILSSLEGVEVTNLEGQKSSPLAGYLFIKNRCTLGPSEEEILRTVHFAVTKFIGAEKERRDQILKEGNAEIKDLITRAYGLLMHSYQLNTKETLDALSLIKLGIDLGWIEGMSDQDVNQLSLLIRRGHLLKTLGKKTEEPGQLQHDRATFLHQRLKNIHLKETLL